MDTTKDPTNISKDTPSLKSTKVNELKLQSLLKTSYPQLEKLYPLATTILNEDEIAILSEKIKVGFLNKTLNKGTTESLNSIAFSPQAEIKDKTLYLAGHLDLWYQQMILETLKKTKRVLNIIRLDQRKRSLVHDIVKNLDLRPETNQPRAKSRRPFLCRAFFI